MWLDAVQRKVGKDPERGRGTERAGFLLAAIASIESRVRGLGDSLTICFDRRSAGILLLLLLLALMGVVGKFHQSSIGKWADYAPFSKADTGVLLGQPRAIRSDEWLVSTPWMMSQTRSDFAVENGNIGGARAPLLTSVPVPAVSGAFQPELWGFYALDEARGFSWLWMYRLFGLLGSFFVLLLLLTRGDAAVSLIGAASICFSSFTQWWFSTNLPELLVATALATLGSIYIAQSRSRFGVVVGAVLLTVWGGAFVFQIYPPFQVVCGYVALAIVIGLACERERRRRFLELLGWRISAVLASALMLAIMFVRAWLDAEQTLHAVMATVYPGARSTTGGDQGIAAVFNGVFELWRFGEESFPAGRSNSSEAANFPLLFPVVLASCLIPTIARQRLTALHLSLLALCVAFVAWMTIPLQPHRALALAKWTMLSFVPPHRALLGVGIASAVLVAIWVAAARKNPVAARGWPVVVTIVCVLCGAVLAGWLHHSDATFFTAPRLLGGILAIGLIAWAATRGRVWAYAAAVALMAVAPSTVNPWGRGLSPLMDVPAMSLALEESRSRASAVLWLVPGSFVVPQALKANGLPTFGGATYLPDLARLNVLDPDRRYVNIWNRYAHIQVNSIPGMRRPRFAMIDAPGLYGIDLDVCSTAVSALGVTHVAYIAPPPAPDLGCLLPLAAGPVDGLWMYRRRQVPL